MPANGYRLMEQNDNSTEVNGNSAVSGTIRYNSILLDNATIRLSDSQIYEITMLFLQEFINNFFL